MSRRDTTITAAVATAAALLAAGVGPALAVDGGRPGAGAAVSTTTRAWGTTASPAARRDRALVGVAALGPDEAYAVGHDDYNHDGPRTPGRAFASYAERWDGTRWTATPIRVPFYDDEQFDELIAVTAAGSEVWAVGDVQSAHGRTVHTLAVRWNGRAWTPVATPDPGPDIRQLKDVAASAADNVWAVGYYSTGTSARALVIHWDGSAWRVVPVPDIGILYSVTVADDGTAYVASDGTVLRYTGSGWSRLPVLPDVNSQNPYQGRINAIARGDGYLWAVGGGFAGGSRGAARAPGVVGGTDPTYSAYFDGTRWTAVAPLTEQGITDVAATAGGVTAVTGTTAVSLTPAGPTDEATPVGNGVYHAIGADPGGRLWAVGDERTITAPGIGQGGAVVDTENTRALVTWSGPVSGSTAPDLSGRALFGGLPVGRYTITAAVSGCPSASTVVRIVAGRAAHLRLPVHC